MESNAFSPPHSDTAISSAREQAKSSQTMSLIAIVMLVLAPWSCYLTGLFALPLSLYAIQLGRSIEEHDRDEVVEAYLRASMATGGVTAVLSGVMVFILLLILMLYGGLFLMAFAGAAAGIA